MPQGDNVQVAIVERRPIATNYGSAVVAMGGLGQAVRIYAVHYHLDYFKTEETFYFAAALSSNPLHEITPPDDQDLFYEDEALYGFVSYVHSPYVAVGAGEAYGLSDHYKSQIIPLYGIIRPRRQVLCWYHLASSAQSRIRAEIYYEPITLGKNDLETLDRKFGKYRRT